MTPRPVASLTPALVVLLVLVEIMTAACGRGPAPAVSPAVAGDAAARQLVDRFMAARMGRDGQQARIYLGQVALGQYEKGADGLALLGATDPHFARWEGVSSTAAADGSYDLVVRIHEEGQRQPAGRSSFLESLNVGPGPDWRENPQAWIIRTARRIPG